MLKPLRRVDRQTSREDALRVIAESEYGFLAVTGEDGVARAIPMAHVLLGDCLYFHCARAGQKLDDLARQPRAGYTCVLRAENVPSAYTTQYASAMAEGPVAIVTGEAERQAAMRALMEKYSAAFLDCPAYDKMMRGMSAVVMLKMQLDTVCGKANRGKI